VKRNAILAVLVCSIPILHVAPHAQDSATALIARIEAPQSPNRQGWDPYTLQELMERFGVPGVSVAVIKDFQIAWTKAYGQADVTTKSPVTPETMFQAASISKPVTAFAVMRLVDAEKLSLDEDVNRYLKSWKVPENEFTRGRPVTLRALLSHTSGTGDGFGFPGYSPSAERPTLVQILNGEKPSNVGRVSWERPPFTASKYSGGGTVVVQLLLTDTLGKPFHEIMRELVLDPVGMKNSTYEQPLPPQRDSNAARAHDGRGRAMDAKWHVYPEQAPAGLWTTPTDLAKLAIELQKALRGESRILSRGAAQEMITPVGTGHMPSASASNSEKRVGTSGMVAAIGGFNAI
jgi:CubicO group peptidase (beta-lactamase class C family)